MHSLAHKYPRQRGILGGSAETIVNLTAILAIISIVMGGAYMLFSQSASTSEWQALTTLITNVKTLYAGEPYPADSTSIAAALISNNATGNSRVDTSNGLIYNNYSTKMTFTGAGGNFSVLTGNIPFQDCVAILKQVPGSGFASVTVAPNGTTLAPPVNLAQATAACKTGVLNSITLTPL